MPRSSTTPFRPRIASKDSRMMLVIGDGIPREREFLNSPATDQVLLDDAFKDLGRAGVVPDALGINDGDWPLDTDSQTVGLSSIHQRLRSNEVEFLQAAFQELP